MKLMVFSRMLCEISMYFSVVSLLNAAFAFDANYFAIAAVILLFYMASYMLRKKAFLRCACIVGLSAAVLFVSDIRAMILIGPFCIYVALTMALERYDQDYSRFISLYKGFIAATVILFVICIVGQWMDLFNRYCIGWIFTYFVTGIMVLRMIRQADSVLEDKKFMLMNLVLLIVVCAVGAFLGSDLFLGALAGLTGLIYKYVIAPVLTAAAYIMAGLLWVFSLIKFTPKEEEEENKDPDFGMTEWEDREDKEISAPKEDIQQVILGIVIIITAIGLYFLFRYMLGKKKKTEEGESLNEVRAPSAGKIESEGILGIVPRNARDAVRFYYRRFQRICGARGIAIMPWYNTTDIRQQAVTVFSEQPVDELRDVYLAARYDMNTEVTKDQVQYAKERVKQLRAEQRKLDKAEKEVYKEQKKAF